MPHERRRHSCHRRSLAQLLLNHFGSAGPFSHSDHDEFSRFGWRNAGHENQCACSLVDALSLVLPNCDCLLEKPNSQK